MGGMEGSKESAARARAELSEHEEELKVLREQKDLQYEILQKFRQQVC